MTENNRWLLEWVDNSHIRTFHLIGENVYEPIKPHGSEVYSIGERTEAAFKQYWKEWTGRTGYLNDKSADICFLFPQDLQIDDFIQTAKTVGIKFSDSTAWSIDDVVDYIRQSGRKITNVPVPSKSAILSLDSSDGQNISACQADKCEFLSKSTSNNVDFDGANIATQKFETEPKQDDVPLSATNTDKNPISQSNASPRASTQEIRDAMRRMANRQCKTVDLER